MLKLKLFVAAILLPNLSWACFSPVDRNLNFEDLQRLIRDPSCQVKSVDDILSKLPEAMRSRLALFYKSKSLQDPKRTNYLYPRAILSSAINSQFQNFDLMPQPAVMVSFNGHESQAEHNSLEVVSMNPSAQDSFEYFEIKFPSDQEAKELSWNEAQLRIQISEANPSRCVQCHGLPARPIFQSYPTWEGAFGSGHTKGLSDEEAKGFKDFIKLHSDNSMSRYRHLNPARFSNYGSDQDSTSECQPETGLQSLKSPLCFTSAMQTIKIYKDLVYYDGIRAAKIVQDYSFYQPFKFAITAAFKSCNQMTDFFPRSVLKNLKGNISNKINYSEVTTNSKAQIIYQKFLKESEFGDFGSLGDFFSPRPSVSALILNDKKYWKEKLLFGLWVDTIEKQGPSRATTDAVWLRLIVEGQGEDLSRLFLDQKQPTYRTNFGVVEGISGSIESSDSEIKPFADQRNRDQYNTNIPGAFEKAHQKYCSSLKEKSLESLEGYTVKAVNQGQEPPFSAHQIFVKNCIRCHVDHQVGPAIPFYDESALRDWLKVSSNLSKIKFRLLKATELNQMPPNKDLTEKEKSVLIDYLNQF